MNKYYEFKIRNKLKYQSSDKTLTNNAKEITKENYCKKTKDFYVIYYKSNNKIKDIISLKKQNAKLINKFLTDELDYKKITYEQYINNKKTFKTYDIEEQNIIVNRDKINELIYEKNQQDLLRDMAITIKENINEQLNIPKLKKIEIPKEKIKTLIIKKNIVHKTLNDIGVS